MILCTSDLNPFCNFFTAKAFTMPLPYLSLNLACKLILTPLCWFLYYEVLLGAFSSYHRQT